MENRKEEKINEVVMVIIVCQIDRLKNNSGDNWTGLQCISRLDELRWEDQP